MTSAHDVALRDAKARLRDQARQVRREAHQAGSGASVALATQLAAFLQDVNQGCLAGYWPIGTEIDPLPVLAAYRGTTALPTIVAPEMPLLFRAWKAGDPLVSGPMGTREPEPSAEMVQPGVVLVPGLAFDRSGHRLGYGGGYYDRTLVERRKRAQLIAIGVCYTPQIIDHVPSEAHDVRLDVIATPDGVIEMPGFRRGTGQVEEGLE